MAGKKSLSDLGALTGQEAETPAVETAETTGEATPVLTGELPAFPPPCRADPAERRP